MAFSRSENKVSHRPRSAAVKRKPLASHIQSCATKACPTRSGARVAPWPSEFEQTLAGLLYLGRLLFDLLGERLQVELLPLLRERVGKQPPLLGERPRLAGLQPLPRADRLEFDPRAGGIPDR